MSSRNEARMMADLDGEFEIVIQGHIDLEWEKLFEGFSFEQLPNGTTLLRGEVVDQPAFQSLLMRISKFGWTLLRVEHIRKA